MSISMRRSAVIYHSEEKTFLSKWLKLGGRQTWPPENTPLTEQAAVRGSSELQWAVQTATVTALHTSKSIQFVAFLFRNILILVLLHEASQSCYRSSMRHLQFQLTQTTGPLCILLLWSWQMPSAHYRLERLKWLVEAVQPCHKEKGKRKLRTFIIMYN